MRSATSVLTLALLLYLFSTPGAAFDWRAPIRRVLQTNSLFSTQPYSSLGTQNLQLPQAGGASSQGDSLKAVPSAAGQAIQNQQNTGGVQFKPAASIDLGAAALQWNTQTCNPWTHNSTYNGCVIPQANGACPLQCTKNSPAGCSERFQCWQGCPACLPPPMNRACYGYKQIEIGQLDTTIGFQEVPYGNLTYWFDSSSLYLSINLTQGMVNKPIGVYVFKGTPPTGPPPQLDSQGNWNTDGTDSNWDMLVAPYTSCVSYVKDLSPLNFGDHVYISVASFSCAQAEGGGCGCKNSMMDNVGGNLCIYQPEPGKKIPTSSPSRFSRAPFSGCEYVIARYCPAGFTGGDIGASCMANAERCSANNTCGGGPFPVAPDLACKGFNPEGVDLGTLARCATNAYDNNGYLTLDFTCSASVCIVDSDCPLGYMCAQNTPCLDNSNQCTQRCVPLAAAFCKGICPNALDYVPSNNPAAAAAPDLSTLSGAALTQALGAQPGSSQGRSGASKWLRAEDPSQASVQPEISNVINLG
ncbi:hypothetical protein COCOBI_09-2190 [Coccomyxa sp. Obi]|nr:hypothetical protein COCOBI_09-2190 [Coccomyxa sp. Obi]